MAVWSESTLSEINKIKRNDAEYYQPYYRKLEKILNFSKTEQLSSLSFITDGIHGSPEIEEDGIRYISAKCVKDNYFITDNCIFISHKQNNSNPRTQLKDGDVIITTVGTIGNVAVVDEDVIPSNCDRHVGIIRIQNTDKLSPYYISTFLNSKYGRFQSMRESAGNVQLNLYIKNIGNIYIPRFFNDEKKIAPLTKKAYEQRKLSQSLYTQAQQLLEYELGLDKLEFKKPVGYEASFSEVVNNNRADADYYQTKFRFLKKHIRNINTKPLSQIANFTKGIEVGSSAYTDEGKLFLRVSNVKETGIETGSSDKYINNNLFSSLQIFQPEINELLLTKDGTPGICYVVDEIIDGIISGGIVKVKIINTSIPSEYLALVINSKICRMQVERVCSGALIVHWKPGDISKLQIPILSDGMMKKLSKLVAKSKQAKRESQQLLNQAKTRVEQLIEEAPGKNE